MEDAGDDYKGMEYDADLAEDVYYYILGATQPWTVGRIFRAASKKFTGTDRSTLHATIVATLVTMRKTTIRGHHRRTILRFQSTRISVK